MDEVYNLISVVSTNLNMNGEFGLLSKTKVAASKIWLARTAIQTAARTRKEN
jgi:hypothetical protein